MSLDRLLQAANTAEVAHPDASLLWRYKSVDVGSLPSGRLLMALVVNNLPIKSKAVPDMPMEQLLHRREEAYRELIRLGLVAVSMDGGVTWIQISIVSADQRDVDAGKIAFSDLPPGGVQFLGARIFDHSLDGGAARDRLTSFRGAPSANA